MRIRKIDFHARVKGELQLEFSNERLTSFSGLELVRRYVLGIGFKQWLRDGERRAALAGDFRFVSLVLLVVGMLLVGGRRLRHLRYLRDDPMVRRFAGLAHVPDERTLSRSLKRFGSRTWGELDRLNERVVEHSLQPLELRRMTIDLDGTVMSTGLQVERAFRGFNPHHRKNPSYYPLLAVIAQTGHVVAHRNRSGNVHDSVGSAVFLRQAVCKIREDFGFTGILETRTDCAFFMRPFLEMCDRYEVEYAAKVPMWPWLNLRAMITARGDKAWSCVNRAEEVEGFFAELPIPQWNRTERIAIYRRRVNRKPVKGLQLDLFNPDDGYWQYSVVATNKSLDLRALYRFMNGRGVQEKTIAELKGEYAFASIPTNHYGANTAWQKLNILAHNLIVSFQLATTAKPKPRTLRRTAGYLIKSVRSLRFEWIARAGLLLRPQGTPVIRLACNESVEAEVREIERMLPKAA